MMHVKINVDQQDALVDDVINITVTGLSPSQSVTIQASLTERDHTFGASGCYTADADGCVDLSRHASVSGTYEGVSAMGLFWSLKSTPDQPEGGRLLVSNASLPLVHSLTVHNGHLSFEEIFSNRTVGQVLCQTSLRRWYKAKGVRKITVRSGRVRGTLFLPEGRGPFSGLVDMFGSAGSLFECRAALLASRGFAALALAFFNYEDLPSELYNVELEYFMEAVDWLAAHPCVLPDKVGVIGVSKGGEIALHMGYYIPKVKAVVSINGAPYLTGHPIPYKGGQLRAAPLADDYDPTVIPTIYILRDVVNYSKAKYIPIWELEDVRVLLISGGDDMCVHPNVLPSLQQMYPDDRKANCQLAVYPGAGHLIEPPYAPLTKISQFMGKLALWGGKTALHAAAQEDAWKRTLQHFRSNLDGEQKPNAIDISCKL